MAFQNSKTKSLLKILASERGRVFSTDELIEYLWPGEELSVRSAESNLRSRVAELRKILEPALVRGEQSRYILTRRGGYLFSLESDCWIDAEEFSRLEERGRIAHGEGRFDEALSALERAVVLYGGGYLAEDRYEEWALQVRERFRERFVEVLSLLADSLARRGQYRTALGYLERAVGESPLYEGLYRQMMVYAFCGGERARARHAYERCRAVLERELGERPSSQTEELYRQIQAERVSEWEKLYPRAAPQLVTLPAKIRRPPFVGRTCEWEQLTSALRKACSGEGHMVLILGEAGVGKTRLSEEFARWAQEHQGAQTLSGRCYELESPMPFHLWIEVVRQGISKVQSADLAEVPPAWLWELSQILPELRCVFPNLPSVVLPTEHRQYRLFETLSKIMSSLALRAAPLLVTIDDLQWADTSSLDFLCYLLGRFTYEPVLIVATARSEELSPQHERVRHQGLRLGRLSEIVLHRLSEQEIGDLVRSLADEVETTEDFGGRLYRESVGNPLFVTAVLQALFENGAFVQQGSRWRLTDPAQIALTPSAVQLLERRVKRVSTPAQRVLQLVACAVQIDLEVLEEAWEGSPQELFTHLAELTSQGLLIERGGRYELVHDKLRAVVYDRIEEPRRVWLHRRIAQALERVYADPTAAGLAGQVAQHYELGSQPLQALEWVLKAVQDHQQHYRHQEGLAAITKGFNLLQAIAARLPKFKHQEFEYRLLESRITLSLHLGQLTEVHLDLERLSKLAQGDPRHQARVHLLRADWYERLGEYSKELTEAQQALVLYQSANDRQGEVSALRELSLAHYYLGNLAVAAEGFQKLVDAAEAPEEQLTALENLALICRKQGDLPKAHHYLREALQLATARNLLDRESDLWYTSGSLEWQIGRYQGALEAFHKAHHICKELGDRYGMAYALLNLSITLSSLGDFPQALHYAQESETLFAHLGNHLAQATAKRHIAKIYKALGDYQRAHSYLEEALQLSSQDPRRQGECLALLAEILLAQGQPQRALEYAQQALAIAHQAQIPYPRIKVTLAEILLATGDAPTALKISQQTLTELSGWGGELVIHAYYQHSRILHALHHPEAPNALRKAYDELLKTANHITDPSLRQSFLAIPLHRHIRSNPTP